jgi:hypothetical protein
MSKLIALALSALTTIACVSPIDDRGLPADAEPLAAPAAAEPVAYPSAPVLAEPPAPKQLAPIRVWIAPQVQEKGVREAVDAWAQVTAGVREWVFVEATNAEIIEADLAGEPLADLTLWQIGPFGGNCMGGPDGGALGCVLEIGGLWENESGHALEAYLIDTTFSADGHAQDGYQRNAKLVAMHEIGHLLGLTHDAGGIMAPATAAMIAADWECPDAEVVDALQSELGVEGLHACALPAGL